MVNTDESGGSVASTDGNDSPLVNTDVGGSPLVNTDDVSGGSVASTDGNGNPLVSTDVGDDSPLVNTDDVSDGDLNKTPLLRGNGKNRGLGGETQGGGYGTAEDTMTSDGSTFLAPLPKADVKIPQVL